MKKLFGTDGMRGEAGEFPLDAATVETVGASLATHLTGKTRTPAADCDRQRHARVGRMAGTGVDRRCCRRPAPRSKSAGVITTPGVAFLARTLPADAGVVISASHNAYRDNGIKIFAPSGRKLDEETERLIESDVFARAQVDSSRLKHRPRYSASTPERLKRRRTAERVISTSLQRNRPGTYRSTEFDSCSIARTALLRSWPRSCFERLGATVTAINNKPDGRNINLDCGSLHTEALKAK